MKRFLTLLTCLVFGAAICSGADRDHTLKIYNWADYIDESLLDEFEAWYEEQTGESVKIVYEVFDMNEVMLSKIEKGHSDFDVVCPSDYIIERMLRQDLLLPIDRDFGETPDYITPNLSPFIVEKFNHVDGNGKNANDYAVAYMWGTTGIMYNPRFVSKEEVQTWDVLKDPRMAGHILMKDSFRDVYTCILIRLNRERIDAGEVDVNDLTYDASDESIAMVEAYLNEFKDGVIGYEADFGKDEMVKEKAWMNLTYSGDAVWGRDEAAKVGVELDYVVPKEGSIVWFDGWVIPKYARNVKAARYFINYMCKPGNAIRNMTEVGYVVAVGGSEVLAAVADSSLYEAEDAIYFFGEEGRGAHLDPIMYPSDEVIALCGMEHDNGDRTEALLEMWNRVKGDNANAVTYIIVAVLVIAVIAGFVIGRRGRKHGRKARK